MLSAIRFYLQTRFMLDEEGQGMVEYGLILALVAIAAIATLQLLGGGVDTILQTVVDKFTEVTS